MNFVSLFSGIEAASCGWGPLGWKALAFAEIEPFPSAVLAFRWPSVPNLGDVTKADWAPFAGKTDVLVGGPPCQAFSVAGLRRSLDDDRGNLTLRYVGICDAIEPRFIVYENVPGILSTKDNAFGCLLAALVGADAPVVPSRKLGWTDAGVVAGPRRVAAWRTLDAQFFGVPQRRRRVFVVACPRDGADPAQILFECASLSRDPPPRRETRKDVAPTLSSRPSGGGGLGTDFDCDGGLIAKAPTASQQRLDGETETFVSHALRAQAQSAHDTTLETYVAHSLRAGGFDASEDGTGRGTPLVPVAVDLQNVAPTGDQTGTLDTSRPGRGGGQAVLSVALRGREGGATAELGDDKAHALRASQGGRDKPHVLAFKHQQSGDPSNSMRLTPYSPTIGTGSAPAVLAFSAKDHGADAGDIAPTLRAGGHAKSHANGGTMPAVAFHENQRAEVTTSETAGALKVGGGKPGQGYPAVAFGWQNSASQGDSASESVTPTLDKSKTPAALNAGGVRRLTPRECERLQGFPDSYTDVPYRGKPASDGPRYKALGNSMAVPVMHWIGRRIQQVMEAP